MATKKSSDGAAAVKSRPTPAKKPARRSPTSKTKVTVKYDAGFSNQLYIRGEGANLSWDKGIELKNIQSDEWTWETTRSIANGEFKILINDAHFEQGENHKITTGETVQLTPCF